jgi:hypothetical protein
MRADDVGPVPEPSPERAAGELGQLRVTVAQLTARLEHLESLQVTSRPASRTRREPRSSSPPGAGEPATNRRGLFKRLGATAAGASVAALGASALGWPAKPAEATHGGSPADPTALHVGQANTTSGATSLARTNGTVIASGLKVTNDNGFAIHGDGPFRGGVHGDSNSSVGVSGTSQDNSGVSGHSARASSTDPRTQYAGVSGTADSNHGVLGVAVAPAGSGMAGVFGRADVDFFRPGEGGAFGVRGESGSHGVFGQSHASAGTVVPGVGMLAAGVAGRTSSTVALYGYADGPPNPNYAPVGGVGQSESGFGVWGLSSAGPGATTRPGGGAVTAVSGVLGTSANNVGVYAISSGSYALAADGNGPNTVAVLGRALGGGQAAVFVGNVEIQGHLSVTGGVNGPVAAATAGEAAPASLALVEAVGRGQVERGTATVALDPTVAAQVQGADYDVFLTSYDNVQLHVATRTAQGFEVRVTEGTGRAAEIAAGRATAAFSYRVVARRRPGAGGQRPDGTPLHVPTIPVPQGVPTLPVGRETAPPASAPRPPAR